jgi:hypothetical protein
MSRIAKADVNAALQRAATNITSAAGADGRTSRAELKEALKGLTGTEKKLTDVFFKFVDHRDFKKGAQVTASDVSRAVTYATEKLIAKYDLNNNGLSPAEVKKMSLTGKLSVDLARELKAAAANGKGALEAPTFHDFLDQVKVTSERTLTSADASSISPELTKQIIAACHQSSHTDVKTLADAFEAVDQGEFVIREGTDKKTGAKYLSVDYGAGDNTYGAIFKAGTTKVAVAIQDGDLSAP